MSVAKIALLLVFAFTMAPAATFAGQQPDDPPMAPVPTPITTAKKVFISNASGELAVPAGTPDLTYNAFYAAMKSWGRYELVSMPSDADLAFEIRFTFVVGPTTVSQGNGGSGRDFQFRLTVLDPKSHIVLWAFSESVPQSGNKTKSRNYFDQAMAALVNDIKKLVSQSSVEAVSHKN